MKQYLFLIGLAAMALLASCKKSTPADNGIKPPITPTGDGSGNPPTSNPTTGNTTNYNGYIVKTVGVSKIRIATDANDKLTIADFVGGGNHIVLKPGTGNPMSFYNQYKREPSVAKHAELLPNATYWSIDKSIDNGKQLDTANTITIKIKGFDKNKDGFNQMNLVLCKDVWIGPTTPENFVYLAMDKWNSRSTYKDSYFSSLLTTEMKISSYELAKPLAEKPYIVRNMVVNSVQVNYTEGQATTDLKFFEANGISILKLGADIPKEYDLMAGNNLTTELVNADKQPIQYVPKFSQTHNTTWYYPTLTNLVGSSFITVAEPVDSVSKAFVRVSGFDVTKCGFNELRIYLMQDPYNTDLPPIQLVRQKALEKPTLEALKAYLKTSGLTCYQFNPY